MPRVMLPSGVAVSYDKWGSGPPLLLLLPSGTRIEEVRAQLRGAMLMDMFACLAFEPRGYGRSDMPNKQWPSPSLSVLADDAMQLMQMQGWSAANVLGISFGGMIAQELLLRHPSAVIKMVLVCTSSACTAKEHGHGGEDEVALTTGSGDEPGGAGSGTGGYGTAGRSGDGRNGACLGPSRHADVALSYPMRELYSLSDQERMERLLLLADTRRDAFWLESDEGRAAMSYLSQADRRLRGDPAAVAGREWLLRARDTHNVTSRLRLAFTNDEARVSSDESSQLLDAESGTASCVSPSSSTVNDGQEYSRCTSGCDARSAPSRSGSSVALVIAAAHDAITPPRAASALRDALGCRLVWFDTGHWPVLPSEALASFDATCVHFLRTGAVAPAVLAASELFEAKTLKWDPTNAPDCMGGMCVLL